MVILEDGAPTCAWSSSAACVSNPGDWYSKCASGGVRFSGCVEDSGRREVLCFGPNPEEFSE